MRVLDIDSACPLGHRPEHLCHPQGAQQDQFLALAFALFRTACS